jgi:regulator of sigma D
MLAWLKPRNLPTNVADMRERQSSPGNLQSRRPNSAPERPSGLAYDPGLIAEFLDTHQTLLALHGHARTAAFQGNWKETSAALEEFRIELTDHLVSEGIRLYVYLKQSLKEEPEIQAQMRHFATEMHGIGAAVMKYLDAVRDIAVEPYQRAGFIEQWDQIGGTLVQRIQREEKVLYPMYQPYMAG